MKYKEIGNKLYSGFCPELSSELYQAQWQVVSSYLNSGIYWSLCNEMENLGFITIY